MPIYLVQHGLAVPESVDPNRPLSADGREEVERVAAHLRKAGVAVKRVCHSGKTRAKETAQILAEHLGDGNIYEVPGMNPNDNVIEFAASLKEDTMYVGHLPHLGKLISYRKLAQMLPSGRLRMVACALGIGRICKRSLDKAGRSQKATFPGVRGKGITSLILPMPVTNWTSLSKPSPNPEWGAEPNLLSSRYHQ